MKILIINIISLLFLSLAFGHDENRFENKQLRMKTINIKVKNKFKKINYNPL